MTSGDRVWRELGLRSAVLAGDEQAWRVWYEESFPALYSYVNWRCAGLRDLCDDIVQETWLTAVRRVRTFSPERGSFAGWLRGIAVNVLRHHLRRARANNHVSTLDGLDHAAPPDASAERRETAERIVRALEGLPERYEAVLRAKYLEQQSVNAIGAAWNETPKAIESLLTRARQAFRERFEQD
jgi:RNA polymerase sigma-70 factor (ECF subfamily)